MRTKLKYQPGGSAPCARCGAETACEFLDGEDRLPACPECGVYLHQHPDQRPILPPVAPAPSPARSLADRRHAAAVEEMAAELAGAYPEPVDVFEDGLAAELGLRRYPGLPLEDWRQLRVQYIEERT